MEENNKEIFLGLDIGTSSVGWAVTDERYNLMKYNNNDMWGVRLFPEAESAAQRRGFRSARRRLERRKKRIKILQDIFAQEICKRDPAFFLRLKESMFHLEDKFKKEVDGELVLDADFPVTRYSVFSDENYTDIEYHKDFPTIYHLRYALINENDEKHNVALSDIRLVYLAIAHMMKNRGHFLFEGQDIEAVKDFSKVYNDLSEYVNERLGIDVFTYEKEAEMRTILLNEKIGKAERKKQLANIFKDVDKENKKALEHILGSVGGSKFSIPNIFNIEEPDAIIENSISFEEIVYDEKRDEIESVIAEDIELIDILKRIYDYRILNTMLEDHDYISEVKINEYEEHKRDLNIIKTLVKKYLGKTEYKKAFVKNDKKEGYIGYIETGKINRFEINKYFRDRLRKIEKDNLEVDDLEKYEYIMFKLENNIALKKQRETDNSVIPYQLHLMELKKILENVGKRYSFLNESDEEGHTNKEKIVSTFKFRIPYYVGPLNANNSKFAWIVKKENKEVLPWKFNEVVDINKSAENFITRMTNKCTYLIGEDVLPKESMLYQKFMVLNELNIITVKGQRINSQLKKQIFNEIFEEGDRITTKAIKKYIIKEYQKAGEVDIDEAAIAGLNTTFAGKLSTEKYFKKILGEDFNKYNDVDYNKNILEKAVYYRTIYGDEIKLTVNKLIEEFGIDEKIAKKLSTKKFAGWGRLSKKLLVGIPVVDKNGEILYENIIEALYETNLNFMEMLSDKYYVMNQIAEYNSRLLKDEDRVLDYDKVFEDRYLSPSVRRGVWQTLKILEELIKLKHNPTKIFLEMTRFEGEKKKTKSRKEELQELYKHIKNNINQYSISESELAVLTSKLEQKEEAQLRSKKLYLYFTQLGKDMYTGNTINISDLNNNNLYDIDHIYPRSLTKDDSIRNNLVLTLKTENATKTNEYPLNREIRHNRFNYWKMLADSGLISQTKYQRLIRDKALTDDELAGFISRQLVETSQSVKSVADIIKMIYQDEIKIVYVKAGHISDFRQRGIMFKIRQNNNKNKKENKKTDYTPEEREYYTIRKVRDLNDMHHAKDAYLNIVVGNVYNNKYTENPKNFVQKNVIRKDAEENKEKDENGKKDIYYQYNLLRTFFHPLVKGNRVIWEPVTDYRTVKQTTNKNTPIITRMTYIKHGGISDQNIVKKSDKPAANISIKKDLRLKDTTKYGYYNKLSIAYFCIIKFDKKNKRAVKIVGVPVAYADTIKSKEDLKEYFEKQIDGKGNKIYPTLEVVVPKVKINTKMIINNHVYYLTSKSNDQLLYDNGVQLTLPNNMHQLIKDMSEITVNDKGEVAGKIYKLKNITEEDLIKLFKYYVMLLTKGKYKNRRRIPEILSKTETLELFKNLSLNKKIYQLKELNILFNTNGDVNLLALKGKKHEGKIYFSSDITDLDLKIVNESVTGLRSNIVEINKL